MLNFKPTVYVHILLKREHMTALTKIPTASTNAKYRPKTSKSFQSARPDAMPTVATIRSSFQSTNVCSLSVPLGYL